MRRERLLPRGTFHPDYTPCGLPHPSLVTLDHFDVLDEKLGSSSTRELFQYEPDWGLPPAAERERLWREARGEQEALIQAAE